MKDKKKSQSDACFFADTHCHVIEGRREYKDASGVFFRAAQAGVARILLAGSDLDTSVLAVAGAAKYASEGVFAAVGVHPHEASSLPSCSLEGGSLPEELRRLASSPRVAAIGESGLDYHYDHSPRDQQKRAFRAHIQWSIETGLPLIVHGRESYDDIIEIFREEEAHKTSGVVHCFSGTEAQADFFLQQGFYLSFGGPLTFPKNHGLRALFRSLPADRILLETDSPYLTPVPFRGKKNEPAYVKLVYEEAARVRRVPSADFARAVSANAARLFRWKDPYDGEGEAR